MVESAPKGWIKESTLNPNAHGNESMKTHIRLTKTVFLCDQPVHSIVMVIIFSNTAIIVVNAAKLKNKKKKVPQIFPKGILAKIFGNVWKIRPGPHYTQNMQV